MKILIVVCWLAQIYSAVSAVEPCTDYHVLSESRRVSTRMNNTSHGLCDKDLTVQWYRFADGRMADKCPHQRGQCDTVMAVWLNGNHPTVSDGEVPRNACFVKGQGSDHTVCCDTHAPITVKNCGGFFVYQLIPLPTCPAAYCTSDKQPCPVGTTSTTGFEPCTKVYPVMTTNPTLSLPEIQGNAFRFFCNFDYAQHDPHLMFEVQWTFDGKPDVSIPDKLAADPARQFFLPGSALIGHIGQNVGCRVRGYYTNAPVIEKGPWLNSTTYYSGFKVSPETVVVDEKGGNQTVKITSTLPIICDHNFDAACCLHFMLDVDGPRNNVKLASHPCDYTLCKADWDPNTHTASTTITVEATKDGIIDGDKNMFLTFEPLQPYGSGAYLGIYTNYTLPPIPVTAKDAATRICSWSGDPHISGFQRRRFHLFETGDFTMYQHPERFEVQARMIACGTNNHASCQCGIVIREHSDVIRIDSCNHLGHAPMVETNRHPLRQGTRIERSSCGKNIIVYLPSGREIRIDAGGHYHNVHMTVPGSDYGHGRGVCGTLDDRNDNEFTHRNGYVDPTTSSIPTAFVKSWGNDRQHSMFFQLPHDINDPLADAHFCQCDKAYTGEMRINCSVSADNARVQRCGSSRCQDVTNSLPSYMTEGWVTRRDMVYGDFDIPNPQINLTRPTPVNLTLTWPTPSGITESQARDRCTMAIHNAQLFAHCAHDDQFRQDTIDNCMLDVQLFDGFELVPAHVSAFTAGCQFHVIQQVTNYDVDNAGQMMLKPTFADLCSTVCYEHGTCVNGQCQCQAGYTGDNCQLQLGKPLVLHAVRGSSYCDLTIRPCRTIFFDADHFADGANFKCRVQEIVASETQPQHVDLPAQFISGNRLACPLPDATSKAVTKFTVSATFDGQQFSGPLPVTVFYSTCMDCNAAGCKQKPGTCLIDDVCHQDGDHKDSDSSYICNPQLSTMQWSRSPVFGGHFELRAPTLWHVSQTSNNQFLYHCSIPAPDFTVVSYHVDWLLDGKVINSEVLDGAQTEATLTHSYLLLLENDPNFNQQFRDYLKCRVKAQVFGNPIWSEPRESTSLEIQWTP